MCLYGAFREEEKKEGGDAIVVSPYLPGRPICPLFSSSSLVRLEMSFGLGLLSYSWEKGLWHRDFGRENWRSACTVSALVGGVQYKEKTEVGLPVKNERENSNSIVPKTGLGRIPRPARSAYGSHAAVPFPPCMGPTDRLKRERKT